MPIIYEVSLKVQSSIASSFADWLPNHIDEMLKLAGFVSANLFAIEDCGSKFVGYVAQYELTDREALDHYLSEHSAFMRQDAIDRFGDKFSATRRILQKI